MARGEANVNACFGRHAQRGFCGLCVVSKALRALRRSIVVKFAMEFVPHCVYVGLGEHLLF